MIFWFHIISTLFLKRIFFVSWWFFFLTPWSFSGSAAPVLPRISKPCTVPLIRKKKKKKKDTWNFCDCFVLFVCLVFCFVLFCFVFCFLLIWEKDTWDFFCDCCYCCCCCCYCCFFVCLVFFLSICENWLNIKISLFQAQKYFFYCLSTNLD